MTRTVESTKSPSANIAGRFDETARRMPQANAIVVAKATKIPGKIDYHEFTFAELQNDTNRIAAGLRSIGIGKGTKVALFVRFGYDFVAIVFALFKIGAIQILIDPGMGIRQLLGCLDDAQPDGFVAISEVQAVRAVMRRRFRSAKRNVTVGRRWFWGGPTIEEFRAADVDNFTPERVEASDTAAIIFTSGSTGPAKGVLYRHGIFSAQLDQIRDRFDIKAGEVDMACFPLFALFNCAMGVTTVIPTINPSRPADVDPQHLVDVANACQATQSFASPAVWNKVGRYCEAHDLRMPTLRRVLSAGAPVPGETLRRIRAVAEAAESYTPYGATEALPVAAISSTEVLDETQAATDRGAGVCVGRRFAELRWKVVRITDDPIAALKDAEELPTGEIGELLVAGPVVTPAYATRTDANALAKIADGDVTWHRMGDVGYLDEEDRFWFCGRKSHRVETARGPMYTIRCEAIVNQHPRVFRSALVGVGPAGRQCPVLVLEPYQMPPVADRSELLEEVRAMAQANPLTECIDHFLLHSSLPVDPRHNSKIVREKLAVWAAGKLPGLKSNI